MTISNQPLSYLDCYDVMDKALADVQGVRVQMRNNDEATFFRMRIHQARSIDRKRNKDTYDDPGHPMHGASLYDRLIIRIHEIDEVCWVYIQQSSMVLGAVEVLSEVEPGNIRGPGKKVEAAKAPLQIEFKPTIARRV